MKLLLTLLLGLIGLVIILGGLGAVAEDTFPAQVPIASAAAGNTGATAGDPTLLILVAIVVVVGFTLGNRR